MKVLIIAPNPQDMGGISEYFKLIEKYKHISIEESKIKTEIGLQEITGNYVFAFSYPNGSFGIVKLRL